MNLVRTQGIVIGQVNAGETDKILTVFTRKHGVIKAAVKGACRLKSTTAACSQFLVFSDFIFYKGKDLYNLNSCEIIEAFYNIRNDVEKLAYASYAAEIVKEVVHENMPSFKVLQLFLNTLYAISTSDKSLELIIRSFQLRLMAIIGYRPQVELCASCHKTSDCKYFSFEENGLVCENCGSGRSEVVSVSDPTIQAMRYIIYSDIKKLFAFSASEVVLKELKIINEIYLRDKLEREFNSLKMLEKI